MKTMNEKVILEFEFEPKKAIDAILAAKKEIKALKEANKDLKASGKDLSSEYAENEVRIKSLNATVRQQTRDLHNQEKAQQTAAGSINKLRAEVSLLTQRYNALSKAERENTAEGRALQRSIATKTKSLKELEGAVGNNRRRVGDYREEMTKALQTTGGFGSRIASVSELMKNKVVLGFTAAFAAVAAFGKVLYEAVQTAIAFQAENSKLASILGTTRSQIKDLTNDARELGSTTAYTAREVTQLQIELAKLGFDRQEIKDSTSAILALAAATGESLPEAAKVAASTVRGFELETRQTARVTDVMAKSFSNSALDMSKFSTAMAQVAPVAKNANQSLELTTAQLGILVDRGVDASTAGTALRGILLDLAGNGLTLEEAFEKINTSTNKNATAFDLFGKRGATVATILAENTEQTGQLTQKLNEAGGSAQKMADEQLNNLQGEITVLKSAWEGFLLSIENGDGLIGRLISNLVRLSTTILGEFTPALEKSNNAVIVQQREMNNLFSVLQNTNLTQDQRSKIIGEINDKYGSYLSNLISEKDSIDQIRFAQNEANTAFEKKIALLAAEDKLAAVKEKQIENAVKELEAIKTLNDLQENFQTDLLELQKQNADSPYKQSEEELRNFLNGNIALVEDNLAKLREEGKEFTEDYNQILNAAISQGLDLTGGEGGTPTPSGSPEPTENDDAYKTEIENLRRAEAEKKLIVLEAFEQRIEYDGRLIDSKEKVETELLRLEIDGLANRLEAAKKAGKDTAKLEEQIAEKRIEYELKAAETIIKEVEKVYSKTQTELAKDYADGIISRKEYNRRLLELEISRIKDEIALRKAAGEDTVALEKQLAEQIGKVRDKTTTEEEQRLKEEKNAREAVYQNLLYTAERLAEASANSQMAQLDRQLEHGKISQERYDKESAKIQTEAAERLKIIKTAEATISTFRGVASALELPPPYSFILAALVAAQGFAQVSNIQNTDVPQFEHGGLFEVGGKRHSQGGTKFVGSDGSKFEAEEGEVIGVINRKSVSVMKAMSAINEMTGGRSFFATPTTFARDGGAIARNVASNAEASLSAKGIETAVKSGMESATVITQISEINRVNQDTSRIRELSRL